ncbi:hypothetical protein [Christiangramia aquimixticola]|uniref:hypothetical protein n=1 Tax=Christiangramia aquimixticola TaxID=1697558 RepID=UPI003AA8822A
MKDLQANYSAIADEIRYYHSQILQQANRNSRVKEIYKGTHVLFSPLLYQPEFLLIGFNPGGGYYKWHGKIVENFEPMQALEYYLNKHRLGEQTKGLFAMAGRTQDLERSTVKINFYPWATDNIADFKELMKLLPSDLSSKLFHLSRVWTKTIIELFQPKTIICEGFKAFEEVQVLFPNKIEASTEENFRSFQTSSGLRIIGYKRNQGSILNKEVISELNQFKFLQL